MRACDDGDEHEEGKNKRLFRRRGLIVRGSEVIGTGKEMRTVAVTSRLLHLCEFG